MKHHFYQFILVLFIGTGFIPHWLFDIGRNPQPHPAPSASSSAEQELPKATDQIIEPIPTQALNEDPTPLDPTSSPLPPTPSPAATIEEPTLEPICDNLTHGRPSTSRLAMVPGNFPADVNPLTGEQVEDPQVLQRRPIAIKVSNYPALVRPQAGSKQCRPGLRTLCRGWSHPFYGRFLWKRCPYRGFGSQRTYY